MRADRPNENFCPADRAARAWYNRGTCLVRRGGAAAVYRSAISCFDRCLESPVADAPLKANARQNLQKALSLQANFPGSDDARKILNSLK